MKVFPLFIIGIFLAGCGPKYCPAYSTYEYNKEIVKEKSYKKVDARAKRKMKKYNAR